VPTKTCLPRGWFRTAQLLRRCIPRLKVGSTRRGQGGEPDRAAPSCPAADAPTDQATPALGRTNGGHAAASPLPGAFLAAAFTRAVPPTLNSTTLWACMMAAPNCHVSSSRMLSRRNAACPIPPAGVRTCGRFHGACLTYGMACYDADPLRARDAPGTLLWPSSDPPPIHGQSSGFSKDRTPAA